MTQIEQMIKDMCPYGVEYKKLGEVLDYEQPTPYLVNDTNYDDSYPTPVLTAGQSFILGYTDEQTGIYKATKETPTIIFDDFTTSFHWVDFDFKVKSSAMKMLRPKKGANIIFRFVYYAMLCIKFQATEHTRYWISKYSQFEIPIPPLEIQKKIVECLDKFSALAAELQAELQMRRKQYEYYRTHLLTPHSESNSADKSDDCNWVITTLGEIGTFTRGRRFVRTDIVDEGQPCIHYGDMYTYYGLATDHARTHLPKDFPVKLRYAEKGDVIIVGAGENDMDIGVGCVWEGDEPVAVHDACYIFKHNQYPRYISHYLRTLDYHLQIKKNVSTAKICAISPEGISKAKIALPPLEEQKRIADFLDKFEVLLNSLSDGIPAEQAAQQKRYEYYRDLLLTFDRKAE